MRSSCKTFAFDFVFVLRDSVRRFHDELETYVTNVERCVSGSLESVFDDEPNSSIRFTRPIPAHENLRKEFFASLETSEVRAFYASTQCLEPMLHLFVGRMQAKFVGKQRRKCR